MLLLEFDTMTWDPFNKVIKSIYRDERSWPHNDIVIPTPQQWSVVSIREDRSRRRATCIKGGLDGVVYLDEIRSHPSLDHSHLTSQPLSCSLAPPKSRKERLN